MEPGVHVLRRCSSRSRKGLTLCYFHLANHTHTGVLDRRLTFLWHTLTNSHNSMPWDLQFFDNSTFVNLAISNINPASYREFYLVPVLVELAHVKEREHEKHVDQTAKSAMYLSSGTALPRHACVVPACMSTAPYQYLLHVQDVTSHTISSLVRPFKYCDVSSRKVKSTE